MPAPQAASAADELLVDALPEDTREALRRLAAAGVLNEVLDAYPDIDEDGVCSSCASGSVDQFSSDTLLAAFRLGWIMAGAIGPAELPPDLTWVTLCRAGVV